MTYMDVGNTEVSTLGFYVCESAGNIEGQLLYYENSIPERDDTPKRGEGHVKIPRCPNCERNQFVRRSRRTRLDIALSLLFLYPFRCESCGERFYRFWVAVAGHAA
jgi:hypothetical protein